MVMTGSAPAARVALMKSSADLPFEPLPRVDGVAVRGGVDVDRHGRIRVRDLCGRGGGEEEHAE
jgi:hypothetical protein